MHMLAKELGSNLVIFQGLETRRGHRVYILLFVLSRVFLVTIDFPMLGNSEPSAMRGFLGIEKIRPSAYQSKIRRFVYRLRA